ncbi:MAG: hypothetical protein R2705_22080 [Ilumatobacteraceae bacterium]
MGGDGMSARQEVLFLWLDTSSLASRVLRWAFHSGADPSLDLEGTETGKPPYARGVDALADGWRLIQTSQLMPPTPGAELQVSHLKHEFLFERWAEAETP